MAEYTLIDEYFDYQKEYERKYGTNTLVFMEVGSFFECYEVNNELESIGKATLISELLNIQLTRRNKSILENSRSNPMMCGVNSVSFNRYLEALVKLNKYTIVIISQITPPPNPKRAITNIISPGTILTPQNKEDSYLVSIYIQKEQENIYTVGCSAIDLSTGKNFIAEYFDNSSDKNFAFDCAVRFINTYNPKEIYITGDITENIIRYLEISNIPVISNELESNVFKLSYQKELLNNIFKYTGQYSIIEYLDLEKKHVGLLSYIACIKFAYEHNENIINKINKPVILEDEKYLILNNNTITQLNLINNNDNKINGIGSVLDVIDKTSTSMGRRILKERLVTPIIDEKILNYRYYLIEEMKKHISEYTTYLNEISDIERLHRKMALNTLSPMDYVTLYDNIKIILKLPQNIIQNRFKDLMQIFIDDFEEIFIVENMSKCLLNDIKDNFINDKELLRLGKDKENALEEINNIVKKIGEEFVSLDRNERDGYFLSTTKNKIKNINTENFKLTVLTNNIKITFEELDRLSDKIIAIENKIKENAKEVYLRLLGHSYKTYSEMFYYAVEYVSELDIAKSGAQMAIQYNYNKPIIEINKEPFIESNEIRHPIVEILQENEIYVTNDILLNDDNLGMLIYGTNASGKSVLMKAIGINLILAQAGYFVAATSFKYSPFYKLFTRISGSDNVFKGLSTFALEMTELRGILNRMDKYSLILGDEISHGTESISGTAIVAAAILRLEETKAKFVFATHLHDISKMKLINEKKSIKHYHLKATYNEDDNTLIYNRKLISGAGNGIYGLEVAKSLQMEEKFLKLADKIRKEIMGKNKVEALLENPKVSKYNKDLFITHCEICNKEVEATHHIIEQSQFDKKDKRKNHKANLMAICNECHSKMH